MGTQKILEITVKIETNHKFQAMYMRSFVLCFFFFSFSSFLYPIILKL